VRPSRWKSPRSGPGRAFPYGVDARLRRCPEPAKRTALDSHVDEWLHLYREVPTNVSRVMKFYRSLLPRRPGANASRCAAIYDDVSRARGSCRLGSNQWCDFSRERKCVDRSACVWCYDRLGAHPGGVKLVNAGGVGVVVADAVVGVVVNAVGGGSRGGRVTPGGKAWQPSMAFMQHQSL